MTPLHRPLASIEDLAAFLGEIEGSWESVGPGRGCYVLPDRRRIYVQWTRSPGLVRFWTSVQAAPDPAPADGLGALALAVAAINRTLAVGALILDTDGAIAYYASAVIGNDDALGSDVCANHMATALSTVDLARRRLGASVPLVPSDVITDSAEPGWARDLDG